MFDFGLPELLVVLVIVVLLFGPGRLANIMGEVGKAVHSFKESISSEESSDSVSDVYTSQSRCTENVRGMNYQKSEKGQKV